jgi:predicted aspartyl protease
MSAGKGSVQLVNGADQIGTAVVTATYTYTVVTADDTVKTAATTLTFGQTDANLNISGKRVTADWVFAAGKTVTITRDGVTIRTFKPTANSADSFSFNLKKSSKAHRVTIKINGVTVTDAGYLVKK